MKTVATTASVADYLAAIEDEARRADCTALCKLMQKTSGWKPQMWGTAIVGFGRYAYRYESGTTGESCVIGFSSRKGDISVYLSAGFEGHSELLAKLGKHKMGKACLYLRKMSDVDEAVLREMVAASIAHTESRWGKSKPN